MDSISVFDTGFDQMLLNPEFEQIPKSPLNLDVVELAIWYGMIRFSGKLGCDNDSEAIGPQCRRVITIKRM